MDAADGIAAVEIGDGARHAQDAVIAACCQTVLLGGLVEQGFAGPVGRGGVFQYVGWQMGVEAAAPRLNGPGGRDPGGCGFGAFDRGGQGQIGGRDGRHLDLQIDPVEHRAGNARLVITGAARTAATGAAILATAATAASLRCLFSKNPLDTQISKAKTEIFQ